MGFSEVAGIAYLLAAALPQEVRPTVPKTGRRYDVRNSPLLLSPLGTTLFNWTSLAFCDFAFEFSQQRHTATSGREVPLNLFIPSSCFQLLKPVSELFPISLGQVGNGFLDCLYRHILTIACRR